MRDKPVYIDRYLAACYAQLGRMAEAEACVARVRRLAPKFSLRRYADREMFKSKADLDHMIAAMRKAGLPE
jgi:hypothetical protein